MSKKRPRAQPTVDTQLVELYDDLANENEGIRIKAAEAFSIKFSTANNNSSQQISEALRRLIRGLCSSRYAARLGFSVALTEFLFQHWGIPCSTTGNLQISQLIDVLVKQTEVTGKVAGQEERDHHIGRVFGARAFIQSGILLHDDVPANAWDRILDVIYEAAKNKPWLREMCGGILYEAAQMISEADHDPRFIRNLINKVVLFGLAKTPEGVAIWLKVQKHFPKVELPTGVWRDENPIHKKEKSELAKIMKETSIAERSDGENPEILQKGSWTPKLHFAWNVILAELDREIPAEGRKEKSKTVRFKDFWQVAVDEHLFASTSSVERKYWGFLLFQQWFGSATRLLLPALFSPRFVRCLTNQLASKERYLHLAAEKTVKSIMTRADLEPSVASIALRGLLANTSDQNLSFDILTKTKTVERLMVLGDDSSLRHFVPELCDKLVRPGVNDEKDATARRQITIDQLTLLLKSRQSSVKQDPHSSDSLGLTCHLLEVLATYSYFSMEKSHPNLVDCPVPPMSERTQETLRSRLSTCLSFILTRNSSPAFFASHVVDVILRHEADERMHSILELKGTLGETIPNARTFLENIHNQALSESRDKPTLHAFELLYSLTILQLYNGDPDAVSILGELRSCYDLLVEHRQIADQVGPEVFVEVLLSFVSKPSQLFRRLAQQVFTTFTPMVQHDGLRSMIKVLETEENLSGQDEMFEDDTVRSMDSSSDDSAVGEVDMTNSNEVPSLSDADEDSQASSERNNGQIQSEDGDKEVAVFEAKLSHTLEAGESTDEDMNDEQMEALDETIASIFKERKKVVSKKKQKMDAKETIVNFKCRVLELLEIFIKQRHKEQLALDLLVPLLTVTRTTTSKLVSVKACNVMRSFSKLCKGQAVPRVEDQDATIRLLKEVHVEAMQKANANACSQASLLLVKVLVANGKESLDDIFDIYSKTQRSLLDPRCGVKPSFFIDWVNWCNSAKSARQT
ncbi:DNA-directed DNA polymerase [Xanthoria calcicola]